MEYSSFSGFFSVAWKLSGESRTAGSSLVTTRCGDVDDDAEDDDSSSLSSTIKTTRKQNSLQSFSSGPWNIYPCIRWLLTKNNSEKLRSRSHDYFLFCNFQLVTGTWILGWGTFETSHHSHSMTTLLLSNEMQQRWWIWSLLWNIP